MDYNLALFLDLIRICAILRDPELPFSNTRMSAFFAVFENEMGH